MLDEPTSGVDPMARDDMWGLLRELAAEGVTALVSTHVMPEAERCDRLGLLAGGRLVATGTPAELIARSGLTIARIDASPWKEAFGCLKAPLARGRVARHAGAHPGRREGSRGGRAAP